MFRSRFHEAFPQKLINFGPQDIESGIVDGIPSPLVESLLCALLAILLNRKKPIEYVITCRIQFGINSAHIPEGYCDET
jgi:hypothetical protein